MTRTFPPVRFAAALALSLAPALLAGCSNDSQVLARIDGRTITRRDFVEVAARNPATYGGPAATARAALLDDLVKRELLVLEAHKRGLMDPAEEARLARQAQDQLALSQLFARSVPRDVPVSDAEVDTFYRLQGLESHARVVFTLDRPGIDAALAEIRAGHDLGAVADRWNQANLVPPHGDIGFVTAGALIGALDRAVTRGRIGEVQGPIESEGEGWFLVQVLERRPRKQQPLAGVRGMLADMIRQRKQHALLLDLQRGLLAQYHVTVEPDAPQVLFMRYNQPRDTTTVGGIKVPVPAAPTPGEARRVLARYDGADGRPVAYTLADAIQDLQDPSRIRPSFSMVPVIRQWLLNMALQRVALIEAQRRHFGDEPEIARQVRQRVDNQLLQAAYSTLIVAAVNVSDADVRADYERLASGPTGPGTPPPPFEKLDEGQRNTLKVQLLEQRRVQRLDQVLQSLRATYRPVTYPERLARVPWPVPPAAPQGT